jgi:hypothetical protein
MKNLFITLILFVLASCGSSAHPSLVGDWEVADTVFTYQVKFDDSGNYQYTTNYLLEDGSLGIEVETGDYIASDNEITSTTKRVSCPAHYTEADREPTSVMYDLSKSTLSVHDNSGEQDFSRSPKNEGSNPIIRTGCIDYSDSVGGFVFTTHDVGPL